MKICIVGAGAIGSLLGTKLAIAGKAQLSVLARGANLTALRTQGWRLQSGGALLQAPAYAEDSAAKLGVQDLIIICVKGDSLAALAPSLAPMIDSNTLIMPAMNGVPWWFCDGLAGFDAPLTCLDANGAIARALPTSQLLGCVVHASAAVLEPGWVNHKMGQGLLIGDPDNASNDSPCSRAQAVVNILADAGFEAKLSANIRYDIWYKLWGNLTMNPVSAMTGASTDAILTDPLVREFCSQVMLEAARIGQRIGCPIAQNPEERHAMTAKLGAFKTSMLQDALAGRALELDSIVGAVQEIAQRLDIATPNINTLLGLSRLFARSHGLYPEPQCHF